MAKRGQPDGQSFWISLARAALWVWIGLWAGSTAIFLVLMVSEWTGLDPARDYEAAMGGAILAPFSAGLMIGGIVLLRRLRRRRRRPISPPLPSGKPRPARNRLPSQASAARGPMQQLNKAEDTLAQLLGRLDEMPVSAVPPGWTSDTRKTAAEAATELRAMAITLETVELAVGDAPPAERESLHDSVLGMRDHLAAGLAGFSELIAAASRVLIASSATPSAGELTEATDHLAALALALRELPEEPRS